jgi:ParB family chromosome partitioning protein
MSARERGLGRGLGALLGESAAGHQQLTVPVGDLTPGPYQPRRRFDQDALAALAASIRERGIMQPILVRRDPARPGAYQIVAGERRWRAAQIAQVHEVPAIVRELDDRDALEIALIENVQREDLSPLEEAEGYRRLIDEFGGTQEDLARQVGKSRSHVANMLRLLSLPAAVREMLDERRLSAGHARALLGAAEPESLARKVVARGLNVRQTEALVRNAASDKGRAARRAKSADVVKLEHELTAALGLKVSISARGESGEVRIAYRTLDQLDALIGRLRNPRQNY